MINIQAALSAGHAHMQLSTHEDLAVQKRLDFVTKAIAVYEAVVLECDQRVMAEDDSVREQAMADRKRAAQSRDTALIRMSELAASAKSTQLGFPSLQPSMAVP